MARKTDPLVVLKEGDMWSVKEAPSGELVEQKETKAEAAKFSKLWAEKGQMMAQSGPAAHSPVVIHDSEGSIQRVWWPPQNRLIRIRPLSRDDKEEYEDLINDFESDGRREPYWLAERTSMYERYVVLDVQPSRNPLVEDMRDKMERENIRRLSVYGKDWTVKKTFLHPTERKHG